MSENRQKSTLIVVVVLLVVVAGAAVYLFTSRTTPGPVETSVQPSLGVVGEPLDAPLTPPGETVAPVASVARSYEPIESAPLTLGALQYMPDGAQVALGIPAAASLVARVVPFAQQFLPDVDLEEELALIAADLAQDAGVSDDEGLVGVLAEMGIDSQAGMALFLDMSALADSLAESADMEMFSDMPDMSEAKAMLVAPVNDPAKAEASLLGLAGDIVSGMSVEQEEVDGVTIHIYEGAGGYFLNDAVLAVSNDIAMLRTAVARAETPARFQYGSAVCPPDDVHEAVALIFGDRLIPLFEVFAAEIATLEPTLQILLNAQMEKLEQVYGRGPAEEPLIITARVDEELVELKSKIDTAVYPELLDYLGEATPLRWAQLLPENTMTFLSLNFSEEAKEEIKDVYLESIPEDIRVRPGVSQGLMYGSSALQLLGGEITLGITGFEPIGFPSVFLMIELANTAGAQILLQMAPQVNHDEPYRDVQIKMLGVPFPIPVFFALVDDGLILSNSDDGMRAIIDLVRDGETSGLFASLNPPIAPDTPIYQAFLVKPSLYHDIIEPLAPLSDRVVLPDDAVGFFEMASRLFEDIRMLNEMQDTWSVSRIFAFRKPVN